MWHTKEGIARGSSKPCVANGLNLSALVFSEVRASIVWIRTVMSEKCRRVCEGGCLLLVERLRVELAAAVRNSSVFNTLALRELYVRCALLRTQRALLSVCPEPPHLSPQQFWPTCSGWADAQWDHRLPYALPWESPLVDNRGALRARAAREWLRCLNSAFMAPLAES
ncbi:unnamed protein product [Hapterophycus canaliculatus]